MTDTIDNGWHERGELPPVGVECEHSEEGVVFIVAKHHFSERVIFSKNKEFGDLMYGCKERFRPIKTEREKFVERYEKHFKNATKLELNEWAGSLFDSGMRYTE